MKTISIKEFRELGCLQELNRRFLHPLGLGLSINIDPESGEETLGEIWDYREDPEGLIYDIANSDKDRIARFRKNKEYIDKCLEEKRENRIKLMGNEIEPIP